MKNFTTVENLTDASFDRMEAEELECEGCLNMASRPAGHHDLSAFFCTDCKAMISEEHRKAAVAAARPVLLSEEQYIADELRDLHEPSEKYSDGWRAWRNKKARLTGRARKLALIERKRTECIDAAYLLKVSPIQPRMTVKRIDSAPAGVVQKLRLKRDNALNIYVVAEIEWAETQGGLKSTSTTSTVNVADLVEVEGGAL